MKVRDALRTLEAVRPALPRSEDLAQEVADAMAAQERGYYLPDEDERLREVYRRYLVARGTLWEMVLTLKPRLKERDDEEERLRVFGVSFCAAAMLVRSASFVIGLAKERPVVWKKLDEAEVRNARLDEIKQFYAHGVYETAPIEKCWSATGKKPIQVKWIDINKGDEVH